MKSNKLTILRFFLVHIVVYYFLFSVISDLAWCYSKSGDFSFFGKEEIVKTSVSPFVSLLGMYDGYILLLIPHILLFLLFEKVFRHSMMKGFILSSLIVYFIIYLNYKFLIIRFFFFNSHYFEKYSGYDILPIMVLSLLGSFFVSWLFKGYFIK